jgi:predicted Zn-dependent protease
VRQSWALLAGLLGGSIAAAPALDLRGFDLGKIPGLVSKAVEATSEVDQGREVEIGRGLGAGLLGAAPALADTEVQRYLNRVGTWLAQHTERADLPWTFGVLDTDTINAFAAPGGYVFVTRGLFMSMRDESELAGVVAHEIGHVLRRHHLQAIKKQAQMGLLADLAEATGHRRSQLVDTLVGVGMRLYARGLDREDELEADRIGVVLATRAGYQPLGLPSLLDTLHHMDPKSDTLSLMFSTHPATGERLARLDAQMSGRFEPFTGLPRVQGRFERFRRRLAAAD